VKGEWNWMLDPPKTNIKSIGKEFPPKEVIKHLKSLSTDIHLEMRSWRKHLSDNRNN
jgi:hypothetical protein|tara:strand:+ start:1110 stop:1280 length:171 start_codon:yes stop_codon:yes gene_type:complete